MMHALNTIDLFIDKHKHNWYDYRPSNIIQFREYSLRLYLHFMLLYLSDKLPFAFVFVLHMFVFLQTM